MRVPTALLAALLLAHLPTAAADHIDDLDAEVPWGCPRRDCIPSIDEPTFGSADWLDRDDRVLGVVVGDDAVAYPVRILNWHEIVNDVVGGTPVAVTYCPLCGTGITFERTVGGEATRFGVSGRLYKNDLVMYDAATETLWSQELGEAIWGERHGERLGIVPTATTTWREWERAHPDTRVLARPSTYPDWRYDQYPYGNYESDEDTLFPVENPSNALHAKEWVLGVFTDNASVAYRKDDVEQQRVIRDTLDGRPLIVTWVDGSPRARWADDNAFPRQVLGFWFAWHDFHPETRLWGRLLASVVLPAEEGGTTRVVFSEPVDQTALAPHLPNGATAVWADERTLELTGGAPFTIPPGVYAISGTALSDPLHVPLGEVQRKAATPGAGAFLVLASVGLVAWALRRT